MLEDLEQDRELPRVVLGNRLRGVERDSDIIPISEVWLKQSF